MEGSYSSATSNSSYNTNNDSSYTYEIETINEDDNLIESETLRNTNNNINNTKSAKRSSYYQNGAINNIPKGANKSKNKEHIGVRKKFNRVFSNPIIPSLLSLENVNKIAAEQYYESHEMHEHHALTGRSSEGSGTGRSGISSTAGAVQYYNSHYNNKMLPTGLHGPSPLFPPKPQLGLRHTRHTPYDMTQEAREDQVEKESLFPVLPLNYVDPRGRPTTYILTI